MAVVVGSQLQATTEGGDWRNPPTSYTYQWQSASTSGGSYSNIASATRSDIIVDSSLIALYLRCAVTATNTGGSSTIDTAPAGPVAGLAVPGNTVPPTITGTALSGDTVSCSTGSWTNNPTSYTYQWQSSPNGVTMFTDIVGAIFSSLALDDTLVGLYLRCGVIAYNAAGPS